MQLKVVEYPPLDPYEPRVELLLDRAGCWLRPAQARELAAALDEAAALVNRLVGLSK